MIAEIRLTPEQAQNAQDPVWVETRQASGHFEALKLKEVIDARDDLQYMRQTNRNADQDDIPGFTFLLDGEQNLSDFFKGIVAREAEAAKAKEGGDAEETEG